MKISTAETPPLSRAGRKLADAVLVAAKFTLAAGGNRLVRRYEVYGMVVTEWVDAEGGAETSEQR